ncbi:MAG TPA: CHAP domain-containing protein [Methylomirabilota bacterium]|nr:CHAP domain-containing protein [Methylomirabilota bacterium]
MPKRKQLKTVIYHVRSLLLVLLAIGVVGSGTIVHADQFDEKIKAIQSQSNAAQSTVNSLANEAKSYQGAIDTLQAQISGLQASIYANQARQADLQSQIAAAQKKIDDQKKYLGEDITAMYIDGQLSSIESVASSSSLSDFVDKEEYRTGVQNGLNDSIGEIAALQTQLQKQKGELDVLVNTQQQQNAQLATARAQQENLLSYNEGQQSAYNSQINANSGRIAELRRQQIAANSRFIGGSAGSGSTCGGGYPGKWCNAGQDTVLDDWGMYNRECVSYTAFRVAASGRYMPGWGWSSQGNANQWDDNARAAGIPVDGSPRAGDVAISNSGAYGHAMYVESVNGNGTINISQYNASLNGLYSTNTISVGSLVFIHF